ncbi:MAG: hypothetical protein OEV42_20435 [Deltaproteobacteria bacterium]|nr:hypothetical protein [Deltaproteobacteria bacterium]
MSAFLVALVLSAAVNRPTATSALKFNVGLGIKGDIEEIEGAVKQYNINSASFYNTAGLVAGLEEIPAAPLLKRRLFKDINMLKRDGLVMVFDRDRHEVKNIEFLRADLAAVETEEVWAVNLQEAESRKPLSSIKASHAKVRYILKKEPFYDRGIMWVIYDADLYSPGEEVPQLNRQSVL